MSILAFPLALINSAGMLSTPADFPMFSTLTAASTSSRRIEGNIRLVSVGSQELLDLCQSYS